MHAFDLAHLLDYFAHYGYWAVVAFLLLENMGLPIPGETALLAGSALAAQHRLNFEHVILVGIAASIAGDNIGYVIGRWGGRKLLHRYHTAFHIPSRLVEKAEGLIARHGAPIICIARFIAGLRMVAGPLAGMLGMRWTLFALCDLVGATVWVCTIATLGYSFGNRLPWLMHAMGHGGRILAAVGLVTLFVVWKIKQKRAQKTA